MFDTKTSLTHRLANATDLLLDFATLGEYGLEPVGRTPHSCETRRRDASTGNRRRRAGDRAVAVRA
jgi:hypothetical protein